MRIETVFSIITCFQREVLSSIKPKLMAFHEVLFRESLCCKTLQDYHPKMNGGPHTLHDKFDSCQSGSCGIKFNCKRSICGHLIRHDVSNILTVESCSG